MIGKVGVYVWTASSAGWAVLALLTGLESAALVAIACGGMAYAWHMMFNGN